MSRRGRGLSEEDRTLWAHVTDSVAPLVRRRRKPPAKAAAPEPAAPEPPAPEPVPALAPPPAAAVKKPAPPQKRIKPSPAPPLPPLAPIDRHERRRLVRGTRSIDGRIDLHGLRQAEAHRALRGFLAHSQMRGDTLVLVITGKGAMAEGDFASEDARGVLRRMVPHWLRMPDLRGLVVGFEEAHQGHGGGGALYVRLRRVKGARTHGAEGREP